MEESFLMSITAYRIRNSITELVRRGTGERLQCLSNGSVLIATSEPNRAGLVEAKWEGTLVWVFERDLAEGSEPVEIQAAANSPG